MKRINSFNLILLGIISLLVIIPNNIYAKNQKNNTINIMEIDNQIDQNYYNDSNLEYYLNSYDIKINVNENNTLDITETISAYFNVEKHGIYRKIPLKNKITRLDGSTSRNRAQISNIKVNDEYTTYNEDGYKIIKIGNPNQTMTGQKEYTINYLYNLGKDHKKEYDELYFNIIGSEWDTSISNITFSITMPKEFDSSKLGFSSGKVGSTDSSNVTFFVDGKTINGYYNTTLNKEEALTVRLELPEGYFVNASIKRNLLDYMMFIIPIVFLLITITIWSKYGRDDQVVETVEFYPPEGLNSLDVGFLYKGNATSKDVTSLLIYLANKGYLKISETDETFLSKKKVYKITKLKEYDGNNINEKIFFDGLFTNTTPQIMDLKKIMEIKKQAKMDGEKISLSEAIDRYTASLKPANSPRDSVTTKELYNNFYTITGKILTNVNNKINIDKIFEKTASNKSLILLLIIIAAYVTITAAPLVNYGNQDTLLIAIFITGFGLAFLFKMLLGNTSIFEKIFGIIWGLGFGGVPWYFIVLPTLKDDSFYTIGYIIGFLCIVGMIITFKYLPKRTEYGNKMLGKLGGFKNFLETAEKEKLEEMVNNNPEYFYDILPFTYVLGVSDKWIKKFESISLQAPSWYDSSNNFDVVTFGSFIDSTMSSAQEAMSSSPSGDGSGGSGGGSSGGGSGGGGGGSW